MREFINVLILMIILGGLTILAPKGNAQGGVTVRSTKGSCGLIELTSAEPGEECDVLVFDNGFATLPVSLRPLFRRGQSTPKEMNGASGYRLAMKFAVPGQGGWDYISVDSDARRLYVSHGTQLEVLDADSGKVIGQITDTPGVHGAAIAADLKRGFTSNGQEKTVTVFETDSLKTIKKVPVNGTDFILYDPFSRRVFPLTEKVTVLDAISGDVVGELDLGGDPEGAVSDGKGRLYVNLADKKAVAVVDPKTLTVKGTYPIARCTSPHSLSYDAANQRLFVGCRDALAVLDAMTGKVLAGSMICSGVDASGWDAENKLIFESCAEGVISVIRQITPDDYQLVDTVLTQLYAKTMAFDSKTKKIFLPTAEYESIPNTGPKATSPFKSQVKPGSFRVLVVAPQ